MPLMEGIVSGIPKKQHRPVVDGIVTGCAKSKSHSLAPPMEKVEASATRNAQDTFGAGRTPQGEGNGGKAMGAKTMGKPKMMAEPKIGKHMELRENRLPREGRSY